MMQSQTIKQEREKQKGVKEREIDRQIDRWIDGQVDKWIVDESGSGRDRKRIGLIKREIKKRAIEIKILFPNFSSIY